MRLFICALLILGLLLSIPAGALSKGTASQVLVKVHYESRADLRQLAELGLRIQHAQGSYAAALATSEQLSAAKSMGFRFEILDTAPDGRPYYLVYPDGKAAELKTAGFSLFPYGSDSWLLKATEQEAFSLAQKGIFARKLPDRIVFREDADVAPMVESLSSADLQCIQDLVAQVSPDQLQHHICKLQDKDLGEYCNKLGSRYLFNMSGQREARMYIYQALADLGLDVSYDAFERSGQELYNVVATLPGQDQGSDLVYVICAHYDSISPVAPFGGPAPGADDNGTGVAALLEVARVLSGQEFHHTIRFIAFTAEEVGLWGSADYAAKAAARGDHIAGVLNLDMIGYDGDGNSLIELHAGTDPASIALADRFAAAAGRYHISLSTIKYTEGACDRSDHASFWDYGYPALLGIEGFFSGDTNPHYHQTTDTLEQISLSYVTNFTRAAIATMAELARPFLPWQPEAIFLPLLSRTIVYP